MTSTSDDPIFVGLDQKFDKVLADMKPHVLKLPHKTGIVYHNDRNVTILSVKYLKQIQVISLVIQFNIGGV